MSMLRTFQGHRHFRHTCIKHQFKSERVFKCIKPELIHVFLFKNFFLLLYEIFIFVF